MKISLYATFFLNLILLAVIGVVLPKEVASKFSFDGTPVHWLSIGNFVVTWGTVFLFFLGMGEVIHYVIRICPAYGFNVPHGEYWKTDENFPKLRAIMQNWLLEFWVGMFLLLFALNVAILIANMRQPVHSGIELYFIFGTFFVFLIVWLFRLYRKMQPPASGIRTDEGDRWEIDRKQTR